MVRLTQNPGFLGMIRQGITGVAVLCAVFSGAALAQSNNNLGVAYYLSSDMKDPTYRVALQYMESMYKKDPWHWDGTAWLHNPIIGLSDVHLNADDYPEIIAYPTEDEEEIGKFCAQDGKCPHFVLEIRNEGVRRLANISAYSIARDDKNANGYWNIRAYTRNPDVDAQYYDVFVYDPKKDGYVPAPK